MAAITGFLTIYTSARDRNGNCYHAAEYIDTATGATVQFGNIGGQSNMDSLPRLLGSDLSHTHTVYQTLPIREWNRFTKGWPYVCCGADDKAVAAVKAAIESATTAGVR